MTVDKQTQPPILVGSSPAIREVDRLITTAAESDITVLITGESGTGKTLAASRIHHLSGRREGPFVQTNCASLPETLLESEIFGHERGAFTGAARRHSGRFEQADGGTLLLDEVGELSPRAQAKLLQVIEERSFQRVGGETLIRADVRLLVATNADLRQRVEAGAFRRDLFYRLSELAIRLPPLREHPQDIPALVRHFVRRISKELGKNVERVSDAAMAQLLRYQWPGNVRELQNVIKGGLATAEHEAVWLEDLPLSVEIRTADSERSSEGLCSLEEVERRHIAKVLAAVQWKKVDAAAILDIGRSTLDRKIDKYGLTRPG